MSGPAGQPGATDPSRMRRESRYFVLYLLVSAGALAVDYGLLLVLSKGFGIHHLLANPISFTTGAIIAYLGSVYWVFDRRKLDNRSLEFGSFVAIGVGGLLVNQLFIWLGTDLAGYDVAISKLFAAGASFVFQLCRPPLGAVRLSRPIDQIDSGNHAGQADDEER